jgi:hypothetical protein
MFSSVKELSTNESSNTNPQRTDANPTPIRFCVAFVQLLNHKFIALIIIGIFTIYTKNTTVNISYIWRANGQENKRW